MREFYESNKGAIRTAIIMIVITVIVLFITNIVNNMGKASKPVDILKKMGADYYENYLFPSIMEDPSTSATVLAQYGAEGIKVTARDIVSTYEDISAETFYRKGYYCDFLNTYVVIYPKSPYTATDYTLETTTSCKKSLDSNNGTEYVPDTSDGGTPNKAER